MSRSNAAWDKVRRLYEDIELASRSLIPFELSVKQTDFVAVRFYWRACSLSTAIRVLLDADLTEEALILARSLFVESLRLEEVAKAGEDRHGLLLGYIVRSWERHAHLIRRGIPLGFESNLSPEEKKWRKQQAQLENYRRRHGIGKTPKFKSPKDAAREFHRPAEDIFLFHLADEVVHGEESSFINRQRNLEDGTMAVFANTIDPKVKLQYARFSARALVIATKSIAAIVEYEVPETVEQQLRTLEEQVEDT